MELDLEAIKKEGEPVSITLKGGDDATRGEVYVRKYSDGIRIARALRTGGIFLLGTCVLAVVPIAHFILVPLGLLVTIVATIGAMGTKTIVLGGLAPCPYCAKEFRIFKHADKFPFSDVCESCHRQVRVERSPI